MYVYTCSYHQQGIGTCTHVHMYMHTVHVCRACSDLPFISDEVVLSELGQVVGHPGMGQPSHIVVVLSGILCGLVQALQCGPGGGGGVVGRWGEGGKIEREEGEGRRERREKREREGEGRREGRREGREGKGGRGWD